LFAQGEQDKWERNEITGNEIKITGNKKRLKIKIQNQNQIQNKKKKTKKTKSKKSQVPFFSMQGMDKKSPATFVLPLIWSSFPLICFISSVLMLLFIPLRFHLPSIWLIS
jgi:cytoskeletal protein RodZ